MAVPYVAPVTLGYLGKLPSANYNVLVNDIIDLNTRAPFYCTYATRPATPINGQIIYQTDTSEYLYYDTTYSQWFQLAPQSAYRNLLINGGIEIWNRGAGTVPRQWNPTSASVLTGVNYAADRWQMAQATSYTTAFSQVTSANMLPGNLPVGNAVRIQRASTATAVTPFVMQQSIETKNLNQIAGKYLTLSFWLRFGQDYSPTSKRIVVKIVTGTGTDSVVGSFTGSTDVVTSNIDQGSLTYNVWNRYQVSIPSGSALSSSITQLGVSFTVTPVGTAGTNDWIDVTGVQLEVGTAATPYEKTSYQALTAACQRYYYQLGAIFNSIFGIGYTTSTSNALIATPFPVTMRQAPSALLQAGTASYYAVGNLAVSTTCNAVPTFSRASIDSAQTNFPTAATLVAGQGAVGNATNAFGWLAWSAEL